MMYKVVLSGSFQGQSIVNVLYYRTAPGLNIIDFVLGGAGLLTANVIQEVWRDGIRHALPSGYSLLEVSTYVLEDDFVLGIALPFTQTVGEPGLVIVEAFAPAACINVRFQLGAIIGTAVLTAPRRGYVALGPVAQDYVTPDGKVPNSLITDTAWGFNVAGAAMAQNLESFSPPLVWFPIRAKVIRNPITGGPLWTGFADVDGFTIDPVASWRRSRKPGVGA